MRAFLPTGLKSAIRYEWMVPMANDFPPPPPLSHAEVFQRPSPGEPPAARLLIKGVVGDSVLFEVGLLRSRTGSS